MKVLIPYDINTTGMRNPFLFLLLRSLKQRKRPKDHFEHGFGWLEHTLEAWDTIHIHWPEELAGYLMPGGFSDRSLMSSHIEHLESMLSRHKSRGSRIVTTVHNLLPHKYRSGAVRELYRRIYALTDTFIHMGHESTRLARGLFDNELEGKPHVVIPHGDYTFFKNESDVKRARSELGIDLHKRVMLSFGAIRSMEELDLGIDALTRTGLRDVLYLIVGKLPYSYKTQPGYYTLQFKLWKKKHRTMVVERIIPPDEVQWFLNATDIVFIPRKKALNSGNVSLAYTFGKVAVGPDWGVIGEELKMNANPVFDPSDPNSVAEAIATGLELSKTDKGDENRNYSDKTGNWQLVAERHMHAYRGDIPE